MPNALAFDYGDSTALRSRKAAMSCKGCLSQQEGNSNGDVVMERGTSRASDSEKSKLEFSLFMVETGKPPEKD